MPLIKFVFNGHKFATWQPSSTDGPNCTICIFFIMAEIKINTMSDRNGFFTREENGPELPGLC